MYEFWEIEFDVVNWPGVKGVRVFKNGKPQQLGGVASAPNIKSWCTRIAKYYREGIVFKDYQNHNIDYLVRKVAVTGEDVAKDLKEDYPELFI